MDVRVLIVDDCPVMRKIIKRTVELCGFDSVEVIEAGDGKEGLEWVRNMDFDLAIVDLNMPVKNGAEMIAEMRVDDNLRYVPVLTVSAESNETRVEIITDITEGFVHKPFCVEALRDKMLKILEKQSIIRPGAAPK